MLPVPFASKMFAQAPGKWHPSSAASAAVMRTRCALPFLVGAITGEAATMLSLRFKDWKVARRDPTNIYRTAASADRWLPRLNLSRAYPGHPSSPAADTDCTMIVLLASAKVIYLNRENARA